MMIRRKTNEVANPRSDPSKIPSARLVILDRSDKTLGSLMIRTLICALCQHHSLDLPHIFLDTGQAAIVAWRDLA
jgi:hypothetical protein